MHTPAKTLLKVVSVLFIIFGAIAAVISAVGLAGGALIGGVVGGVIVAATVVLLILSLLEFIIGIMGLGRSGDPERAGFFVVSGAILCVIALISLMLSFQVTSLIGFVLPVLYIIGGRMNKRTVGAS